MNKKWESLGFLGKRFNGLACYSVSAFVSFFISPEAADKAMYKTLTDQFKDNKWIRFDNWADEVKRINDLIGLKNTDKESFRGYYDEGCTPCQAVEEDLQNAW